MDQGVFHFEKSHDVHPNGEISRSACNGFTAVVGWEAPAPRNFANISPPINVLTLMEENLTDGQIHSRPSLLQFSMYLTPARGVWNPPSDILRTINTRSNFSNNTHNLA